MNPPTTDDWVRPQPGAAQVTEKEKKATRDALSSAGESMAWTAGYITLPWVKVKDRLDVTREVTGWAITADGQVRVNPDFVAGTQGAERVFTLAHGMMRFLLRHFDRGVSLGIHDANGVVGADGEHRAKLWGKACAMVVNSPLKADAVGRPPGDAVFVPDAYQGPIDAEALFHYLVQIEPPPPPNPQGGGQGQGGGGNESSPQAGGLPQPPSAPQQQEGQPPPQGGSQAVPSGAGPTPDDIDQMRREVEALARQAGRGTHIADALKPKRARTDWRAVIRSGFETANTEASDRTRNTYSRASRRESMVPELVLPGKVGEDPSLCVVMDVSGSVSRNLVERAASETLKLATQYPQVKVFFVTHTSDVCWQGWLKPGGDVKAISEATAFSGGTDAEPAYEAARVAKPRGFDALIHFTDCEIGEVWPAFPARRLIVGACGVAADTPRSELGTPPPENAKVIPISEAST